MKRKTPVKEAPVVDPALLDEARRSAGAAMPPPVCRCEVCGGEVSVHPGPTAGEELCWVCRRLKISAWRDADLQASSGGE
jgi:hypothetical protein